MAWVYILIAALLSAPVASAAVDARCTLATAEDKSSVLSFEEVLASSSFFAKENLRPQKNLGYSQSVFWTKVNCRNETASVWMGIVEIDYSLLDTVDVYHSENPGSPQFQSGDHVPFNLRPVSYRHPAVPIVVGPNSERSVFIKTASSGSVQIPIKIRNYEDFLSWSGSEYFLLGIYNGVVGVIFLIICSLAINMRERFYVFQLCYIAVFHLLQITVNGLGFQFIWSDNVWFNNHGPLALAAWSSAFAVLFSREYLSTKIHFPKLDKATLGIAAALLLMPMAGTFVSQKTLNALASPIGLLISVLLTVLGVISIPRGVRSAGYFVAGWACMLAGIFVASMKGMGILPISPLTNYGMQIGGLAEMILLAVGFTWRMRDAERARREIELTWRHQVKENVKLEAIAKTAQLLAHDIRKPFSMVKLASRLLNRTKSPDDIASLLEKLGPQLSRSEASIDLMLQDLLEATAKPTTYRAETDITHLIETAITDFTPLAEERRVNLSKEFAHAGVIMADSIKLQRVLNNILQNALQAVPPGGVVWIRTSIDAKENICVAIGNSGSFIPEDEQEKIFEMHYTSGKSGGTGLGLAIARKIVSEHGGRISVRSDRQSGTEFQIHLPATRVTHIKEPQATGA